jgi:dTDP-glucose 4,6-dehydratase
VILVTGGAGFIGSNFVIDWLANCDEPVVNLDSLTYAGNLQNLASLTGDPRHIFVRGDICDLSLLTDLFSKFRPRAVVNLAAESHVDRSILGPAEFVRTNVNGTFALLQAARTHFDRLSGFDQAAFRFLHVSTDEVFGSLGPADAPFSEETRYAPSSPYAASKAASDHLVRAYHLTYGLPTLTTNCSNNYGRFQFPEKLIPLTILNALDGSPLPIYGDGKNIRDWIYVSDHCAGIRTVLARGQLGQIYGLGGRNEVANIDVVRTLCSILDEMRPKSTGSYADQIRFVKDRPGHDRRYAMNTDKVDRELGWRPSESFLTGLRRTVEWYLSEQSWVANVRNGAYRDWISAQYGVEG